MKNQKRSNYYRINLLAFLAILGGLTLIFYHSKSSSKIREGELNNTSINSILKNKLERRAINSDRVIVLAGSGSNLAITRILAKEFNKSHPNIKIQIPSSLGTTGGIYALLDREITLGLAARNLTKEEQKMGFKLIPYAKTAIVIGVNSEVIDNNITSTDLINIYQGIKRTWSDDREIIVLSREPGDSSNLVLESKVPGFKKAYIQSQIDKRWKILYTVQEANQTLAKTPFAIGLSDRGVIATEKLNIKVLKFNGIEPNDENIITGKYQLTKVLSFVLPPDKLSSSTQAFIDFVRSKDGAKILKDYGYFPI